MELNKIATGIELIGTTVKSLVIDNSIVDIAREGKRNFGLNINEPEFQETEGRWFGQILIDFKIEIGQAEGQECLIQLSVEGAFLSDGSVDIDAFRELVIVNGVAALIGIARGKIESITANIFNNGKVVIPFVNVIDYYKSLSE